MPSEVIMALGIPIIMGGIMAPGNSKEDNVFFLQAYDIFNSFYKFDRQYNCVIDKLLMNPIHGRIGYKIPVSERAFTPGEGLHKYSESWFNYVTFYKKIKPTSTGGEVITYYCRVPFYTSMKSDNAFDHVLMKIFKSPDNMIRITSIDTALLQPSLFVKDVIYKRPTEIQSAIATRMTDRYFDPESNSNVKILITGARGSQKTYMGKVMKKVLDGHRLAGGRICSTLIDNFNPKDIGVNVETLLLCNATNNNPLIIMINEFDITMNHVIDPNKQCFDPRLCHAQDKTTFNNMLDNIADTRYCITIFTSEVSVEELMQTNEDFKSFMRKGRMDYYVSMSLDGYNIREVR